MAAGVPEVTSMNVLPLPDGLPKDSFSVNVPDDGDCFYHAILLNLQVTKPNHIFGDKEVKDMDINSFKEYLLGLTVRSDDAPGEVIGSLTEKGCWAGEETINWFVSNIGLNLDIYNISSEQVSINRFTSLGNTDTVRLIFTGNHYMAYFFGESSVKVADLGLETLDVDETMAKKVDRKKLDKDNKSPEIIDTIMSLVTIFKIEPSNSLLENFPNLKRFSLKLI